MAAKPQERTRLVTRDGIGRAIVVGLLVFAAVDFVVQGVYATGAGPRATLFLAAAACVFGVVVVAVSRERKGWGIAYRAAWVMLSVAVLSLLLWV